MVLIGESDKRCGDEIEKIYAQVCKNQPYIARMSIESAEIAKMSLNCFLTAKIAFANHVADIADGTSGADKYAILNAIGRSSRIGGKYFKPGYGGPCFVRDNISLSE